MTSVIDHMVGMDREKRSSAAQIVDIVGQIIECADEKDARKLIGIIKGESIKEGGE